MANAGQSSREKENIIGEAASRRPALLRGLEALNARSSRDPFVTVKLGMALVPRPWGTCALR
ncbi:MAG: hypothetical protein M3O36_08965 [Myxococcota bacterium]|nr:hypothetical protein [Myxococcota bacterium]